MDGFEESLARELAKCRPRTDEEIVRVAEKVLSDCGIDHHHWEEVQEVRKDLAWVRDARTRCDKMKQHGLSTGMSMAILAILTLLGLGVKGWFFYG